MEFWILPLILLLLGVIVCAFVLPIIALVRTHRIAELEHRLAAVEQALRRGGGSTPPTEIVPPDVEPIQDAPSPTARRPVIALPSLPVQPQHKAATDAAALEAWVGRRGLGWASAVLLLFATAFFIKYAFDNQWIGPVGRVSAGLAGGTALVLTGFAFHRRGWRTFGQIPSAGGVAMLYLSAFAAFGYYHLIPQQHAAIALVILVIEAAALALLYEAPAIATMALVGGLVTPILLHTDRDQYRSLFAYLTILNASAIGLTMLRTWRFLGIIALLGTQALYWAWYDEHYHPEKMIAALGFQSLLFALGLFSSLAGHVYRPRRANVIDLILLILNAGFFAFAGYVLLDERYHVWLGTLALAVAAVYAAVGCAIQRSRPDDERQLLVVVAIALAFVAIAIPLQADAAWIAVGWAVMGLSLWWFGLRINGEALGIMGLILLTWAGGWLVFANTPTGPRPPFVPLFNKYGGPATVVAACLLAAAVVARRRRPGSTRIAAQPLGLYFGAVGLWLVWFVISVETFGYFNMHDDGDLLHMQRTVQMALSIVWAVYATIVLVIGFRLRSLPLRGAALIVFAVTLAKVILLDMSGLPGFYRVAAFFVLALTMAGAAFGYQKFQVARLAAEREETDHDPA